MEEKESVTTQCKEPETIPYYVHQFEMARLEQIMKRKDEHHKRVVIALVRVIAASLVIILAIVLINLYAWYSYDYASTETVTVDGKDGVASYIGGDGDIHNGENSGQENQGTDQEKPNQG